MLGDLSVEIGIDIDDNPLRDFEELIENVQSAILGLGGADAFNDIERDAASVSDEMDVLLRDVLDLDRTLEQLDTASLDDLEANTAQAEKSMGLLETTVIGVGTAIGAAIGAGAIALGSFAMEADAVFGRLQAQTGASVEEMEVLRDAANETFSRGYGESLEEVNEAISRVKQNMHGIGDDALSDVTAEAMLLADIFDSDINEVTRGAQGLMDAFGISADKAFDLFTKGGQSGLNMSNDMFDQMSEFSPVAKQAGYSVEELFGVMERGAQNGVYNMDRINNSILEFGLRTADGSDATADAFSMLSNSTQNLWKDMLAGEATAKDLSAAVVNELKTMDDQTLANQIGVSLWGTTWEDNTADVMYAMFETTAAMEGFEGATATATDAVEGTFKNRMLGAWRELQTGIAEVVNNPAAQEFFDKIATKAEELIPVVISVSEEVFEFGTELVNTFDEGVESVTEFIDTFDWLILGILGGVGAYYAITGAMALYNGAIMLAMGVGPVYTAITTAMTWATAAFGAVVGFITSPIGIAVLAIGALIAIGVLLYQNWDIVKSKVSQGLDMIGGIPGVIAIVLGPLGFLINAAIDLAKNWDNTKSVWENVWGAIQRSAATSVNAVIGTINGLIKAINLIPGVSIPLVAKVDWGSFKQAETIAATPTSRRSGGGRLALNTGLGRVPYDEMPALLHKDEAVLQADNADALRRAGILEGDGRHPKINLKGKGDGDSGGGPQPTPIPTGGGGTSISVGGVTIQVLGGNTNEQTAEAIKVAIDEYFADLGVVLGG